MEHINLLADAKESKNPEGVQGVLELFIGYAGSHLALEEEIQQAARYSYFRTHRNAHDLFVKNILKQKVKLEGGADIAPSLLATLKSWRIYHIKHDDAHYVYDVSRYLDRKGRSGNNWLNKIVSKFFK